jgi:acetyl esterase/lipase
MRTELLHLKDYYPFLGTEDRDATLELFLPYNMTEMHQEEKKRPCLLICPGGAYKICSQRESEPIALHFLLIGFNVFILNYSVGSYRYPTQVREVAAALELINQNADSWHCDTDHVAIMGFSAGAHLAAHYVNVYDNADVREVFPNSKPLQACILGYPVITADPAWTDFGSMRRVIGEYPTDEKTVEAFSCDKLVSSKTPPTFLWHTATDGSVPVMNSLLYASALTQNKVPFELHVYPRGGHGLSTADTQTCEDGDLTDGATIAHEWLGAARRFLQLTFRL